MFLFLLLLLCCCAARRKKTVKSIKCRHSTLLLLLLLSSAMQLHLTHLNNVKTLHLFCPLFCTLPLAIDGTIDHLSRVCVSIVSKCVTCDRFTTEDQHCHSQVCTHFHNVGAIFENIVYYLQEMLRSLKIAFVFQLSTTMFFCLAFKHIFWAS